MIFEIVQYNQKGITKKIYFIGITNIVRNSFFSYDFVTLPNQQPCRLEPPNHHKKHCVDDIIIFDLAYFSFHLVISEMWYNKHRYNKDFYEKLGITKRYNNIFQKTPGISKNGITNVFEILPGITKKFKKMVKKV